MLVIDDVQRLSAPPVWALVQALADCVPAGSQLVLISRTEPDLALGRIRADRRVHAVGSASLAFDRLEAGQLFEAAGVDLPASHVDQLWNRTEGWPVGLYLAALAIAEQDDPIEAAAQFAGDDRLVVDYVRDDSSLCSPEDRVSSCSMRRCSTSSRLPVCDAVLERDDSAQLLAGRPVRSSC